MREVSQIVNLPLVDMQPTLSRKLTVAPYDDYSIVTEIFYYLLDLLV